MKIFGIEIIVRKYIPEKKWYLYDPEFTNIAGKDFSPKDWVMSKGDNSPTKVPNSKEYDDLNIIFKKDRIHVIDELYNQINDARMRTYFPPINVSGKPLPKSMMVPGKTMPRGDYIDGIKRPQNPWVPIIENYLDIEI